MGLPQTQHFKDYVISLRTFFFVSILYHYVLKNWMTRMSLVPFFFFLMRILTIIELHHLFPLSCVSSLNQYASIWWLYNNACINNFMKLWGIYLSVVFLYGLYDIRNIYDIMGKRGFFFFLGGGG